MLTRRRPAGRRGEHRPGTEGANRGGARRAAVESRRSRRQAASAPGRESKPRTGPQNAIRPRPEARTVPPKSTKQAKARAKARKAKAPKVVRIPLRERLIDRLASIDVRPRTLAAKIPFVVLIIGSLGIGLGITLWLSTDAAARSYQLGNIRERNRVLLQQKEALERDVLTAESSPALADAARELGMIPTRDTAHLVQDPAGNWVVIGVPKPADGVPPPPLNTKLPDDRPAPAEVPVRLPSAPPRRHSAPPPDAGLPPEATVPLGIPGAPVQSPLPDSAFGTVPVIAPPVDGVPPAGDAPLPAGLPPAVMMPPQAELPAAQLPTAEIEPTPAEVLPPDVGLAPIPGLPPVIPGALR